MTAPTWMVELLEEHQKRNGIRDMKVRCAADSCDFNEPYGPHPDASGLDSDSIHRAHVADVVWGEVVRRVDVLFNDDFGPLCDERELLDALAGADR